MLDNVLSILRGQLFKLGLPNHRGFIYIDLPPILGNLTEGNEVSSHVMEWDSLFSDPS